MFSSCLESSIDPSVIKREEEDEDNEGLEEEDNEGLAEESTSEEVGGRDEDNDKEEEEEESEDEEEEAGCVGSGANKLYNMPPHVMPLYVVWTRGCRVVVRDK